MHISEVEYYSVANVDIALKGDLVCICTQHQHLM